MNELKEKALQAVDPEIIMPVEKAQSVSSPAEVGQGQSLMTAIERIAMNPNADLAKMEKLMEMYKDHQNREAELAFSRDMSLCQGEMQPVIKTALNNQTSSTYAKLDDICKAINPVYSRHGFSVTSRTSQSKIDGHFLTITDIRHQDGHKETIELDLPIDDKGIAGKTNKTAVHGVASTISYARRYSICMGFNVATGDDNDGNQSQADPREGFITDEEIKDLVRVLYDAGKTRDYIFETANITSLEHIPKDRLPVIISHLKRLPSYQENRA